MNLRFKSHIFSILLALLLWSCGTHKNTFIHRGYHNLTARFNGYYWSTEAIKEGVFKIEGSNKENYEKTLSVFIVPTNESAKATFPDFDKAIKKSSLVIQRHTIKDKKENEIPTAGRWIDNNWINIGISRYYKREFFSGIESFDYVIRTYKSKDKFEAMLWAAKCYNEIGAVSQSEPMISILQNDKNTPSKVKRELYPVRADYYIKRGLNKEACAALTEAVNQKGILGTGIKGIKKKYRARYAFIAGQLFEEEKNVKKARQMYSKVISLKPNYDMVFYANIKLSRLADTKNGNTEKVKAKLLKMAKDEKNTEFLDVIYYTLGELEEKERKEDKAIAYYKKSAQSSISNNNQKSASYLKLGEIYFEKANYSASEAYYDSTVAVLPKDHPNYSTIVNRKTTLSTLVGYIKTIKREDSLQKLASMSESDRNKAIDNYIVKLTEAEDRQREELERLKMQNENPINNGSNTIGSQNNEQIAAGGKAAWYFYNPTTISFGVSDFAKKWGNRKLEDNWRRSQKGLTIDEPSVTNPTVGDPKNGGGKPKPVDPRKTRDYYIKQLPLSDSLMKVSHNKIIESDYLLGSTYKEELNNNRKAILAFEDLNNRYSDHRYKLSCYYQLYRLYLAEKNQNQSDFYKAKLLNEYPESEYAKLIKNPKYAEDRNAQRSEVEKFYVSTYDTYSAGDYTKSLGMCIEANSKFGKTDFTPKFEFIRAMSVGKTKGIDSLESALNQLVILYPKSEVTPKANEILLAIKKQKNPSMFSGGNEPNKTAKDTFLINLDIEHFVLIISPDDPKIANPYKQAIDEFNRTFYANKNFSITSNLFASARQMILVKTFEDAKTAYAYLENLKNEPSVYQGVIKKEAFTFFIISKENLPIFYKKANIESYKAFYEAAYKTVAPQVNK